MLGSVMILLAMCVDMCRDMCIGMSVNMCVDMLTCVYNVPYIHDVARMPQTSA